MPKSHPPYPQEFRRQLIDLVRSGRTPESMAQEFKRKLGHPPNSQRIGRHGGRLDSGSGCS